MRGSQQRDAGPPKNLKRARTYTWPETPEGIQPHRGREPQGNGRAGASRCSVMLPPSRGTPRLGCPPAAENVLPRGVQDPEEVAEVI